MRCQLALGRRALIVGAGEVWRRLASCQKLPTPNSRQRSPSSRPSASWGRAGPLLQACATPRPSRTLSFFNLYRGGRPPERWSTVYLARTREIGMCRMSSNSAAERNKNHKMQDCQQTHRGLRKRAVASSITKALATPSPPKRFPFPVLLRHQFN